MKKQVGIVSVILVFFTFFLAIPLFNQFSCQRVINYTNAHPDDQYGYIIMERTMAAMDPYYVNSVMEEAAIENNLVVYQQFTTHDDNGKTLTELYVTSNENGLAQQILLSKGYLTTVNTTYSMISSEKETKIANIMYDGDIYVIKPFTSLNEKGGYFVLRSLDGDINTNIENWINDISVELGDIIYNSYPEMAVYFGHMEVTYNLFSNKLIKLSVSVILVLYLLLSSFQWYKYIAISKLEGNSLPQIYIRLFEKYFIVCSIISLLVLCISGLLLYGQALNTLKYFMLFLISQWIQLVALVQLFSLGLLVIFKAVPVYTATKGKNYLGGIEALAYLFKYGIALVFVSSIVPNLQVLSQTATMIYRHDDIYNSFDHVYRFGTQVPSNWISDIGSEKINQLYNDFRKDVKTNHFGMGYVNFSFENRFDLDEVYVCDWAYAIDNGILHEGDDPNIIRIYLREDLRDKEQYYYDYYYNTYSVYGYTEDMIQVIYIDPSYPINDFYRLLFSDDLYDIPLVYMPVEDRFSGQVNGNTFVYDGTLTQAQQYINDKFLEYGYSPMFRINSEQANFESYYTGLLNRNVTSLLQFLFIGLCYVFTTLFMYDCDYELNAKRYRIAHYEGEGGYHFSKYLITFISPLILALGSLFVLNKINFDMGLIRIVVFMIIIEAISYIVYLRKCYTRR